MRQVLQSGASGFVNKSSLSDELLGAVRKVLSGDVFIPNELQASPKLQHTMPQSGVRAKTPLTQRQDLVLRCLLDGMSNREIGDTLHVSEETIKTHITAILRYFDVQNRTQAVVAAARVGYKAATDS
jgi:DNA-binding NarL/FixJ family response regulator